MPPQAKPKGRHTQAAALTAYTDNHLLVNQYLFSCNLFNQTEQSKLCVRTVLTGFLAGGGFLDGFLPFPSSLSSFSVELLLSASLIYSLLLKLPDLAGSDLGADSFFFVSFFFSLESLPPPPDASYSFTALAYSSFSFDALFSHS